MAGCLTDLIILPNVNKWIAAVVVLIWTLLALGDFPLPMSDDLFFIGPALNMVHGGGFVNPISLSQAKLGAGEHFFAYMPFQSYALLAWLKLAGISRSAFVVFQAIAGAISSLALIALIKPTGGPLRETIVAAGVTLAVVILASGLGLRPDLLALALLTTGTHLMNARSLPAYFGYSLLLFLSVITSPSFAVLVLILLGLVFWSQRKQGSLLLLKKGGIVLLAGMSVFLLFLYLIDFQLSTFLTVFNRFRHNATFPPPYPELSSNLWHTLSSIICTTTPAVLAIVVPVLAWSFSSIFAFPNGRTLFAGILASGLALIFASSQSGSGIVFLVLFDLLVLLFIFNRLTSEHAFVGFLPLIGVAFTGAILLQGRHLLLFLVQPLLPLHNQIPAYLAEIARLHPPAIYVDSTGAAELYNYRLPPNAYDAIYGYPELWDQSPPARDLPVGTVFVVASWLTHQLGFEDAVRIAAKESAPSRLKFPSSPYQLIFVMVSRDAASQNVFKVIPAAEMK